MLGAERRAVHVECGKPSARLPALILRTDRRHYHRSSHRNHCALCRIGCSIRPRQHFLLDVLDELLDLALHFFHALAHLQDDRHAADVDTEVAGQRQNELQPLQVFVGVEASVPFGSRGLEESLALVEPQRLGMNPIHLGHRRDHVSAFGFAFSHHTPSLLSSSVVRDGSWRPHPGCRDPENIRFQKTLIVAILPESPRDGKFVRARATPPNRVVMSANARFPAEARGYFGEWRRQAKTLLATDRPAQENRTRRKPARNASETAFCTATREGASKLFGRFMLANWLSFDLISRTTWFGRERLARLRSR